MEEVKRRMFESLPRYYEDSPEADAIIEANAGEIADVRDKARDLLDQFFVSSATWGLAEWERVLDLPPAPRATLESRRQRILVKLNGTAPATLRYLTDLINVYVEKRDATIIEHPAEYRFEAEIPLDNPIDTAIIRGAVNEVKPAHLAFDLTGVAMAERIRVNGKAKHFDVLYPLTNRFSTARQDGKLIAVPISLRERVNVWTAIYPITNVMRTPEHFEKRVDNGLGFKATSYGVTITYQNSGQVAAGEVEL